MNDEMLLHIKALKVAFQMKNEESVVVDGVDLSVGKGETVAIIGESGSGKSISSLSILGLLPKSGKVKGGSIHFDGKNLLQLPKKEMEQVRGKGISMIFQDAMVSLNPAFKIGRQITEGLRYHKIVKPNQLKEEVLRLLAAVGFQNPAEIYDDYPAQLSGGMKQRALIAMAISCNPKLIIADEPTTALDVTIQKQIMELLMDYKKKTDASILLITHDFGLVAEYADRVYVMFGGKIVEAGDVFTIFDHPIHTYTKGLMNGIPNISEPKERLLTIKDFAYEDKGYEGRTFAPETLSLAQKSYHAPSELVEVEPGHFVRFFKEKAEAVGH
ncbi:ABC transporter ATP-binding protein [Alkalihalobacillus sp. AL-G]|uniref:ABC transporter ATP-binding protein n=1 Tax=Alkalihalobacillus sp. AL-G TaxID=2926399 RepID=UPI00272D6FDF|nr:ABC transporter ATP-binding protein [Alkalihalobacillus sp. AL-G]WLD92592.1 ABC transporter ATP-binding protein [Alkalihalobacillus sp. AL-G]